MSESIGYEGEPQEKPVTNQEAEEIAAAYSTFFSSTNGQIVLLDLQREARQFQCTFSAGDAHHSSFLEGRRNLYIYILSKSMLDDFQLIEIARNRAMRSTR